jgi:hypothetical protein
LRLCPSPPRRLPRGRHGRPNPFPSAAPFHPLLQPRAPSELAAGMGARAARMVAAGPFLSCVAARAAAGRQPLPVRAAWSSAGRVAAAMAVPAGARAGAGDDGEALLLLRVSPPPFLTTTAGQPDPVPGWPDLAMGSGGGCSVGRRRFLRWRPGSYKRYGWRSPSLPPLPLTALAAVAASAKVATAATGPLPGPATARAAACPRLAHGCGQDGGGGVGRDAGFGACVQIR